MSYQSKLAIQLESEKFVLISRINKLTKGLDNKDVTLIISPVNKTSDEFTVHVCNNHSYTILGNIEVSSAGLVHFKTCPELMEYENIFSNICPENPLELLKATRFMDKFCQCKAKTTLQTEIDELFKASWPNSTASEKSGLNNGAGDFDFEQKLKSVFYETNAKRQNEQATTKDTQSSKEVKHVESCMKLAKNAELVFLSSNFRTEVLKDCSKNNNKKESSLDTTKVPAKDDESEYVMIICDIDESCKEKGTQMSFSSSNQTEPTCVDFVSTSSQCTPTLLESSDEETRRICKILRISESTLNVRTPLQTSTIAEGSQVDEMTQTDTEGSRTIEASFSKLCLTITDSKSSGDHNKVSSKHIKWADDESSRSSSNSDTYLVAVGVQERVLAVEDKEHDFDATLNAENMCYKISKIFSENSNDYILGLFSKDPKLN